MAMAETEHDSKQVCVRLPGDLAAQLEQVTEDSPYDIPRSEIIRAALREHLGPDQ